MKMRRRGMWRSAALALVVGLVALTGCTSTPESDAEADPSGDASPGPTEGATVARPEFAAVRLDPGVTSLPERVFTGETRSVSTRLDCGGTASRTYAYIHWKQGTKTLRQAARLLQPKRSNTVAVAIVRSGSEALVLTLDKHDVVVSRAQMGLDVGRWWPEGRVTCTDG